MTNAYDKSYISTAQTSMGRMLDYVANVMNMDISMFFKYFIASGIARQFEDGDFSVIAGKSGVELVYDTFYELGVTDYNFPPPVFSFSKSMEYWTGWALAYFQWNTGLRFSDILAYIPLDDIIDLYHPYHEMDIRQFSDKMKELYKERKRDVNLKIIRKRNQITQKELADLSGIPLRTIQQYEQRKKDISKAQAIYLLRLSRTLHYSMEDLMEKIT